MNALTNLEPRNLDEAMRFSELLANSELVPAQFKGKPGNVLVAIQWGREVGLSPMQALQNIAVINGRPSIWGDAALALVRASSVCDDVIETIEGEGENATAICEARRRDAAPVVRRFSVADARKASLWSKSGPWQQYPLRMLAQRARGFALRDAFPDVLKGVITAEEARDIPREPIDITPPQPSNFTDRGLGRTPGPPHDPETGEIHEAQFAPGPTVADLEMRFVNYAAEGMERLETEWKALTTDQRVALGAGRGTSGQKMANWKQIAASVDGAKKQAASQGDLAEPLLPPVGDAQTDEEVCENILNQALACRTQDAIIQVKEHWKARMDKLPDGMWQKLAADIGAHETMIWRETKETA